MKLHKKRYNKWKKDYRFTKRKMKNIRNSCRSGVIAIDNPEQKGTRIYKDEFRRVQKGVLKRKKICHRFQDQIRNNRRTHDNIVFLNPDAKKLRLSKNGRKMKPKTTYMSNVRELEPLWRTKGATQLSDEMNSFRATTNHIFGSTLTKKFSY